MSHLTIILIVAAVMSAAAINDAPAHTGPDTPGPVATAPGSATAGSRPTSSSSAGIVTIRPSDTTSTRQGLPNFVGISGASTGARGISMNLVIIPPGGSAKPHRHRGYETAIYVLKGRVRTRYGEGLCESVVHEAGDFVFIPADVPHQPVNLSATGEARAIVARTDPNEQESVELYEVPGREGCVR